MACVTPRQVSSILSPLVSSGNKKSPSLRSRDNLYRQLLGSYSCYDWCNKPLPLSPLQCAKWGWQSAGKDTLQCKLCKVTLHFVCAFQPWQSAQYEQLCKGFGVQLQTSHLPACPWASRPLSNDVVFGGRSSLIYDKPDFVSTFFDLLKTFGAEKIPVIEVPGSALKKLWSVLSVIFKSVKSGRGRHSETTSDELDLTVGNVSLLLLSLFGWRKSDDSLPTIHCKLCLRTLGLWNFRSLRPDAGTTVLDVEETQGVWTDSSSYTLYSTARSRELSSASELSHSNPSSESTAHNSPGKDSSTASPDSGSVSPDAENGSPDAENGSPDAEMTDVSDVSPEVTDSNEVVEAKAEEIVPAKEEEGSIKLDTSMCKEDETVKVEDLEGASLKTESIIESTVNAKEESTNPKEESTDTKDESAETKDHTSFGNPDIFLPVASYVLFQPRPVESDSKLEDTGEGEESKPTQSDIPKSEDTKITLECVDQDSAAKPETGESNSGESLPSQFKTPLQSNVVPPASSASAASTASTRVLRSRSITAETPPIPRTPTSRKRKSKTADSPPAATHATRTTRQTRSGQALATPLATPCISPLRKRRRSKLEITESFVSDIMRRSPTQLNLSSSNPANLNLLREHHYWCPWVCTLPSYHVNKSYRVNKAPSNAPSNAHQDYRRVSVVDQSDTPGWETLLFHLTTVKSPGNAWIAVHNMLEDCVSQRM